MSFHSELGGGSIVSGGIIDGFGHGLLDGLSGSGGLSVSSDGAEHVSFFGASFEDSTPVIEEPAVGNEDGVNDGPDTGTTEGDSLNSSENEVSHVESIETEIAAPWSGKGGSGLVAEDGSLFNRGPGGTDGGSGTNKGKDNEGLEHYYCRFNYYTIETNYLNRLI